MECRLLRHAWESTNDPYPKPLFGERLCLRCWRCGTVRSDIISRVNGDLLGRRYDYPDGYQLTKADERPTTAAMRVWSLDHTFKKRRS